MTDQSQTGLFISFEGGEGSGKSTQIKLLRDWLLKTYPDAEIIISREPGGTISAEEIRQLLVTGESDRFSAKTDALLMLASRVEHVERLIKPALARGAIIISDRFVDSSYVYQSLSNGYDEAELRLLHKMSINSLTPDITYLFDLPPEEGLARANGRSDQQEARFESKGLAFHKQVRERYASLASQEPARFTVIDALQSIEEIQQKLQSSLAVKLAELGI